MSSRGYNIFIAFILQKKNALIESHFFLEDVNVLYFRDLGVDISLRASNFLLNNKLFLKMRISNFLLFFIRLFFERIPTICKLFFLLKKEKIDVVHLNNGISNPVILGAVLANVPRVVSVRSLVMQSIVPRIKLLKYVDCFVACSNAAKKDFIEKYGIAAERVKVVYDGIKVDDVFNVQKKDVGRIKSEFNIKASAKVIGTVGRLIECKRQDLLILAVEKLVKMGMDIQCLIVGGAEQEEESLSWELQLKNLTMKKNLSNQIIFTGFYKNPLDLINAMDVFVLPSIGESFGIVILEAMALGVPVVAFNHGGPAEIITHNDGILVPAGDVDSLAESICKLLKDESFYKTLSFNAKKRVRMDFSLGKTAAEFDAVYKDCLR
ncbi:MAG: glycosyltransferase family 4 protein [Candidatus Omnitrophota bacterium]